MVRSDTKPEEPSFWNATIWPFLGRYLSNRFGNDGYTLSAESSKDILSVRGTVQRQILINTLSASNTIVELPGGYSAVLVQTNTLPKGIETVRGLRVMSPGAVLARIAPSSFNDDPVSLEVMLKTTPWEDVFREFVSGPSDETKMGRAVGAYRAVGFSTQADQLAEALRKVGNIVREKNPFGHHEPQRVLKLERSPYAARLDSMCARMRDEVAKIFANRTVVPITTEQYLKQLDETYPRDSYNSLSIEGYQVTEGLIRRVAQGQWNPSSEPDARNALAARGYFEAFQKVRLSILDIRNGQDSVDVLARDFKSWHVALFQPAVDAGIITHADLAGYRNGLVVINTSRHCPPPKEALMDTMDRMFDILRKEKSPEVRAVLGHFAFVYIHPFIAGNGRVARFLMNAMLASGGYPWKTIEVKDRQLYFAALEDASVNGDIRAFAKFVRATIDGTIDRLKLDRSAKETQRLTH